MEEKIKIMARNLAINNLFKEGFELSLTDDFEVEILPHKEENGKSYIIVRLKTKCEQECAVKYCKTTLQDMVVTEILKKK